jgi:hypothetical protein
MREPINFSVPVPAQRDCCYERNDNLAVRAFSSVALLLSVSLTSPFHKENVWKKRSFSNLLQDRLEQNFHFRDGGGASVCTSGRYSGKDFRVVADTRVSS